MSCLISIGTLDTETQTFNVRINIILDIKFDKARKRNL